MNTTIRLTACLITLAVSATAQRLAVYVPGPAGTFAELQPPSPVLPAVVPPIVVYPTVPPLPLVPGAAPVLPGDSTFNNVIGVHWATNGLMLASQPTPTFAPLGPILPPFPVPPPVLAAIGGGPVTGIAIDPVAGIMFVCGAPGLVVGAAPVPGMPILVPPFPVPFPTGAITGLEWDGATGSLYAVDAAGFAYNFAPAGPPLGPPIAPPAGLPLPATDIAIDKTLRANVAGLRPLYVLGGPMVDDVNLPGLMPMPAGPAGGQGLAFVDHPAANPPIGGCACPGGPAPLNVTANVMHAGNLAWGVGMTGLLPGGLAVFCFDTVFNPAFPLVNVVGCPLGLFPASPTLIFAVGVAGPGGAAMLPLPLAFPVGTGPLYNQNFTLCPADPLGFVFTPTQQIYAAGT